MQAEWLPIILQGSFSEIYVMDCETLRFMQANRAACENLGYASDELASMTLLDIARRLSRESLKKLLSPLHHDSAARVSLEAVHTRKDGSTYPIEFRLFYCHSGIAPAYLAIGRPARPTALSAHIEAAKEEERIRLAREIHDELGGELSAIKMAMASIKKRLLPGDTVLAEKAAHVDAAADRAIEAIHRVSAGLRPGVLDLGIAAAIERQAREFEQRLGIPCEFSSNLDQVEPSPEQSLALFRIVQEALTNIGKHACATRVSVRLTCDERHLRLAIADDGRGIAAVDRLKPDSLGMRGMEERAYALGGRLSVSRASGGGTEVVLEVPLSE